MKAAIYSRKSKFTGKGESIENQVQLCKEYGERLNISEFEIYEDEGFSGGNLDRPEFQRLLKDAKDKRFDVLICYRLDRISRNIADFSNLIDELQALNIGFISIREQFDTSTPMGRAMMYIASVFAQLERETIAERIKDNMLELAKTGRWLGGQVSIGFTSERITYLDADFKERSLVQLSPNPEELELINFIYSKYEELGSVHQIRKYFLQNNIKTKNGTDYSSRVFLDILRNPIYVKANDSVLEYLEKRGMNVVGKATSVNGLLIYNKKDKKGKPKDKSEWIAAIAKHEGIIEAKRWLEIQNTLDKNGKTIARGTSNISLLSSMLRCKHCGSAMRILHGRPKLDGTKLYYYTCTLKTNSNGSRCENKNLNGEYADKLVLDKILELTKNTGMLSEEIRSAKNEVAASSHNTEIELLNKKIADTESSIQNLVKQLSQNQSSIASQYIISEVEKLSKEVDNSKSALAKLKNKNKDNELLEEDLELILTNLSKFSELIADADIRQKKYLVSSIIDNIYWDGNTGEIEINFFGERKKK